MTIVKHCQISSTIIVINNLNLSEMKKLVMQKIYLLLLILGIGFAGISSVFGQTKESKNPSTSKTKSNHNQSDDIKKRVMNQSLTIDEQVKYRSPIRYAVIYNEITEDNIRQIEIMMDEKQFSEKSLRTIFDLLSKRYQSPSNLEVEVLTNLNLIETPEEREMWKDSKDSRFADYYFKYKEASYSRYADGRESFIYTVSILPYKEKVIFLRK